MRETTERILARLAGAASGAEVRLPFAEDLYPRASVAAAATTFARWCRVALEESSAGGSILVLTPTHTVDGDPRKVVGEILNFLLCQAVHHHVSNGAEP